MRINKQIRANSIRVISSNGEQLGVLSVPEALNIAEEQGLDLVEISAGANPPVCKIIDYGKYRYDQTKKEKENKKAQTFIKVKELKFRPNIDGHDYDVKVRRARDFLDKGCKVKVTCTFKGREAAHPEIGFRLMEKLCGELEDVGAPESPVKRMGRTLTTVIAPGVKKKK